MPRATWKKKRLIGPEEELAGKVTEDILVGEVCAPQSFFAFCTICVSRSPSMSVLICTQTGKWSESW